MQTESANESRAAYAEGEVGNERWLMQSGLTWQDVNEQRTGGGIELPYTSYGFRSLNTRLQFSATPDDEFGVHIQLSEQPETPRYDALVPGFGQTQPDSAEQRLQDAPQVVARESLMPTLPALPRAHVKRLRTLAGQETVRAREALQQALETDFITIRPAKAGRGVIAEFGLAPVQLLNGSASEIVVAGAGFEPATFGL